MSKDEDIFISQEIQSLLDEDAITSAPSHSENYFSTIFTVPKKGGQCCPIINLKCLNWFIPHVHFIMEGIQSLRDIILYTSFPSEILEFQMGAQGLPVHLSSLWSLQCSPHAHKSNETGYCLSQIWDSNGCLAQTKEELLKWQSVIMNLLGNLGFLINYKKSELEPTQSLVFLSFLINRRSDYQKKESIRQFMRLRTSYSFSRLQQDRLPT